MTQQPHADVGRAFFPDVDISPNGLAGSGRSRSKPRFPVLPRRRRPSMIALAVVMAGTGALLSVAMYRHADHSVPVVLVTAPVPAGAPITAADLSRASVTVSPGIKVIPATQLGQVVGEIAAVGLRPGTLLAPADLTTRQPPAPGQELVPVAVKPALLPASGLSPGDHVLLVPTPGDQGAAGTAVGGPTLAAPVSAVVAAVNAIADQDGFDVVDLLVGTASGPAVAQQASTGQFALIVTKRGS
ncbi:MAG: SAF domain-containing protein [Streptosporangiaceae bacterium]